MPRCRPPELSHVGILVCTPDDDIATFDPLHGGRRNQAYRYDPNRP